MHVSHQDAIKIYARACRSWYRSRARRVVLKRAHDLQQGGDADGAQVWRQLADEIERADAPPRSMTHRTGSAA